MTPTQKDGEIAPLQNSTSKRSLDLDLEPLKPLSRTLYIYLSIEDDTVD